MARERLAWSPPTVDFLRATIAHLRGQTEAAVALLRSALAGFDAQSLALDATVARYCLGQVLGGDEGDALTLVALKWLELQKVRRARPFLAMMAPGFLSARERR